MSNIWKHNYRVIFAFVGYCRGYFLTHGCREFEAIGADCDPSFFLNYFFIMIPSMKLWTNLFLQYCLSGDFTYFQVCCLIPLPLSF